MHKKYQVFISSTYQDLREEREQVIKAILEMGHIPVGMEMFSAADDEQWKIITRQIDESDYYVLIAAHRYGSVASDGFSYTEKEYDYATSKNIPVLGFVIDDDAPWPKNKHEAEPSKQLKLTEFKTKVKSRLVQFWRTKDDLHARVSISLTKATTAYPRTGWARADEVSGPEVTRELTRLSAENAALRAEAEKLRKNASEPVDEIRKVIRILSANKRKFSVRKTAKWEEAKQHTASLADVFLLAAPGLISENSSLGVAQNVALKIVGTDYFSSWPIGKNMVRDMLADLAALELVEPSKKKHSVNDKDEYWTLTNLGKRVHAQFRRVQLEEGLSSPPDYPNNGA
jgi:cell division protein FtsB